MAASPDFPGLPAHWREDEIYFHDRKLFMRVWSNPEGRTGRALFLVHGFGEQSDRYRHVPHYLQTAVDVVGAIDLPGHGKSAGVRGHCENFSELSEAAVEGLGVFQNWLKEKGRTKRLHWLGHSNGGLTTLKVMRDHPNLPLESVIVSAPMLDIAMPVPKLKEFFGNLIEPLFPRMTLENSIDGTKLSRDPKVGVEYGRDPLNHSKITPRMYRQMVKTMQEMRAWTGPLPYSTMLILPLNDEIVSAPTTYRLWPTWNAIDGKRKKMTTWPGATHESMNDLDKDRVFNAIDEWLNTFPAVSG